MDNKRRLQVASAANPSLRVAAAPVPQPTITIAKPAPLPTLSVSTAPNNQHLFVNGQEVQPSPNATTSVPDPGAQQAKQSLLSRIGNLGKNIGIGLVKAPVQFVNQGIGEAKELGDTINSQIAADTHNTQAFTNAEKAYNNTVNNDFGDHAGLFGLGTFTNPQETRQGSAITGIRKIGAGTAETALSVLPFAKGLGIGADAAESINAADQGSKVATAINAGLKAGGEGAAYGLGNAGAQEISNGKFSGKQLVEGAGQGALFGVAGAAAGAGASQLMTKLRPSASTVGLDNATLKYLQQEKDPNAVHSLLSSLTGGNTSPELQQVSQQIAQSGSRKAIVNALLDLPQEAAGGGVAAALVEDALHGGANEIEKEGSNATAKGGTNNNNTGISIEPTEELDLGNIANGSVPDNGNPQTSSEQLATTSTDNVPRNANAVAFSGRYDPETVAKINTLIHNAENAPRPAGTTRLFQAVGGNGGSSDYYFNNPDDLAAFKNNTTDAADQFKYIDVPTQDVTPAEGKPSVYNVDPAVAAQYSQETSGVSDTPISGAPTTDNTTGTASTATPAATATPAVAQADNVDATTGQTAPTDATAAAAPITDANMQQDVSDLARQIQSHYTPGTETDAEKMALQYLLQNPTAALSDYDQRVMQEFGVSTPNIVAGDEGKFIIPGFSSEQSGSFHEPASALAKVKYDQLLADPTTANQPVMIMAGGTGAGKTSALKNVLSDNGSSLDDYAAVVDTNSNKVASTEDRINQALQSGRQVSINYVYRDPVDSFANGVIPRATTQGRVVPVDAHVDTHLGSLQTIQALAEKYSDNPDVEINVIDNTGKPGAAKVVNLDQLPQTGYTKAGLKSQIEGVLNHEYQKGNITDQDYATYLTGDAEAARPQNAVAENGAEPSSGNTSAQATPSVDDNGTIQRGVTAGVKASPEFGTEVSQGVNATRGVRTLASLDDKAQELLGSGLDNATQTVNAAIAKPSKQISDQDVANVAATAKALQLNGRFDEASDMLNRTAEALTESGRAANAAKLLYNQTPEGVIFNAQRTLTKAGIDVKNPEISGQLQAALEYLKSTPENSMERQFAIQEVAQFVREQSPSKFSDKAFAVWRAGLLTGTQTVGKVGVSHVVQSAFLKAADIPSAAIDKMISLVTGQRSKTLTLRGSGRGFAQGAKAAKTYFKTGIDVNPLNNSAELQNTAIFGNSVPGKIMQKYVDTVGRTHASIPKPFYGSAQLNSLYDQATAMAKNAGLKGDEADYFVEQHVTHPTPQMLNTAAHDAQVYTFQQQTALGQLASQIQQKGGMVGKVIAPFTRVPSAIATDVINYSPVGAVKAIVDGIKAAKSDEGMTVEAQRALSQGLGRSITGAAALAPGLALYGAGLMTLDYPTDPNEQKLWQQEGKQENSVLIGGKWRSLGSLGPLGSILAMGGQIGNSLKGGKDIGGAVVDGLAGGLRSVEDQSYLSGANNAINALEEPGQYAGNFVRQTASSIIPTISGTVAAATDPNARQTSKGIIQGAEDAIKDKIPGLRESLPDKIDNFGQVVPNTETGWSRVFDPFQSSTARPSTQLTTELQRLSDSNNPIMPTTIEKSESFDGKATPLTDAQQRQLQTQIGQKVQSAWQSITSSPGYAKLNDTQKHDVLQSADEDITAAEKSNFAKANNLGANAPGFTGKATNLTQNQKQIASGSGNPDWVTNADNKAANGTSDPTIAKLDPNSKAYFTTTSGMNADQKAKFLSSPPTKEATAIANQLNSQLPNGLKTNASNQVEEIYATYQKAKASGNWDAITAQQKQDTLYSDVVKANKPQLTQDLYDAGGTHAQTYINEGYVTKTDLDDAIDLDNQLYSSGLESSLKFSKTFRKTYGYGDPAAPTKDTSKTSAASSSSNAAPKEVNTHATDIKLNFNPGSGNGKSAIASASTTISKPQSSSSVSIPAGRASNTQPVITLSSGQAANSGKAKAIKI